MLFVTTAISLTYCLIFWKLYSDQFRINGSWREFDRESEATIDALEAEVEEKNTRIALLEEVLEKVRGAVKP